MTAFRADADGDYLRPLFSGKPLTDEQMAIVTAPLEPQLVVAGAGSGKTTVIAARVMHSVAHFGVLPSQVLGLTFTNKAAGELAQRIRLGLAALAERLPADPGDVTDDVPTVATYNSYAAQIVRDHALRIGREPGASLLTEAVQWQLAMRVAMRAAGPFEHLRWTTSYTAQQVVALAGDLSDHLASPDAVRAHDAKVCAAVAAWPKQLAAAKNLVERGQARGELLELVAAYSAEKQRLDVIDFGDQVALAAEIAGTSPEVAAIERDRFRLIVLDEYQDTGVAQRVLLSSLFAGTPVTAVGDPNQAIYGWRGASASNLSLFGDHFAEGGTVAIQPLMTTFRCDGAILDAANAVARPLYASLEAKQRTRLELPELSARPGAEALGKVVATRVPTAYDEANWLAGRVRGALDAGTEPGQVAVLSRRRADFPRLHHAMVRRGIPVEVVGLGGLLTMPEVSDIVSVLSLLADGTANAAAVRLLTGPRWRLGVRDLSALGRRASQMARLRGVDSDIADEAAVGGDLDAALVAATSSVDPVEVPSLLEAADYPGERSGLSDEALDRVARFSAEMRGLRPLVGQPLVDLIAEIINVTGLGVEIEAGDTRLAEARLANVHAFLDVAAQFTGLDGDVDLPTFITYLRAAAEAEDGLEIGAASQANTVKLMTVHAAKGLEWDVVAVPGLVAGTFPTDKARSSWITVPAVLPFPCRGDARDLPDLAGYDTAHFDAFKRECRSDSEDEERRLAYVAMTRARHTLWLSSYLWSPTRNAVCEDSAFLTDVVSAAESQVVLDEWCDRPADGAVNPLLALVSEDVVWPEVPDPEVLRKRRAAAAMVEAAWATVSSHPTDVVEAVRAAVPTGAADLSMTAQRWHHDADLLLEEIRRRRVRTIEVAVPARLTTSQVVALARDEDAFAAALARPLPMAPVAQARRGSRFHQWVEQLYAVSPLLEPDDLPGADDDDLSDAELEDLQAKFLAGGWGERRPVAVEAPFEMVVGGRLIRGRIDAVYREDADTLYETFDVIDYKTGAVPTGREFEAASLQLAIYRLAWADLAGVEPASVTAGFLYVRTGELKRPDRLLERDELAALLETA